MASNTEKIDNWSHNSLTFLYELSSIFNAADNNIQPCSDPLKFITKKLAGSAAIIRLISEEGWMDLYASQGMSKEQITELQHTPIER